MCKCRTPWIKRIPLEFHCLLEGGSAAEERARCISYAVTRNEAPQHGIERVRKWGQCLEWRSLHVGLGRDSDRPPRRSSIATQYRKDVTVPISREIEARTGGARASSNGT